jgi:arylsulfatase A-like enzyme
LPGAKEGLSDKDPTIAELLKPQGYATGQFGKNHLGDRNEFLPTVHGFDEFSGISTISMPRMNRNTRTIRRILRSGHSSARAAS